MNTDANTDTDTGALRRIVSNRLSPWQTVAFCLVVVCAVWAASSVFDSRGPERVFGPYAVPIALEVVVAAVCVLAFVAAFVSSYRSEKPRTAGTSPGAAIVLILACAVATVTWRITTALGTGADIGAGLALFAALFVIAALLFASVCAQRAAGGLRRGFVVWCIAAWLTAPALTALLWNLPSSND